MHHHYNCGSVWPLILLLAVVVCGPALVVFLAVHRFKGNSPAPFKGLHFGAEPAAAAADQHISNYQQHGECGCSPYGGPPPPPFKNSNYNVIDGHEVDNATELPWMTTLFYGPDFFCSASLISSQFVLTAAHCLVHFYHHEKIGNYTGPWPPVETDAFSFNFGVVDYLQNKSGQVLRSKKIFPHFAFTQEDFFDLSKSYEDIAIIQLEGSVNITPTVHPICLSAKNDFARGTTALVAGWGMTTRTNHTTKLHDGWAIIQDKRTCLRKSSDFLWQKAFCCSSPEMICHGDSGGPLVQKLDRSHWYQIGVTTGTLGDGACRSPEVFMRIAPNCRWIEQITGVKCI